MTPAASGPSIPFSFPIDKEPARRGFARGFAQLPGRICVDAGRESP
jgi:hypothetical protein